jgi:hypothetical protein
VRVGIRQCGLPEFSVLAASRAAHRIMKDCGHKERKNVHRDQQLAPAKSRDFTRGALATGESRGISELGHILSRPLNAVTTAAQWPAPCLPHGSWTAITRLIRDKRNLWYQRNQLVNQGRERQPLPTMQQGNNGLGFGEKSR